MEYSINAVGITAYKDKVYFVDRLSPALYEYVFDSEKAIYLTDLDEGGIEYSYMKIIPWNDFLILIPLRANNICIYNISEKTIRKISLPKELKSQNLYKFTEAILLDNKVIIFGYMLCDIYEFDLNTLNFYKCVDLSKNVRSIIDLQQGLTTKKAVIQGNKIFFVGRGYNKVFIVDRKSGLLESITIKDHEGGFSYLVDYEDFLFLVPDIGSNIVRFSKNSNEYEEYYIESEQSHDLYLCGEIKNNFLYMIPSYGSAICKFNIITHDYEMITYPNIKFGDFELAVNSATIIDNKMVVATSGFTGLLKFSPDYKNIEKISLLTDKLLPQTGKIRVSENKRYTLEEYLKRLI